MKKDIDCQVFEDQLDALVNGTLPEEGIEQLRLHASSCQDCAMLFRVKEHLTLPALADLERAVPEKLLANMWERVDAAVKGEERGELRGVSAETSGSWPGSAEETEMRAGETAERRAGAARSTRSRSATQAVGKPPTHRKRSWLIPTLAAASAVLLFSTAFLFSELRRVEDRGSRLAVEIADLQRDMQQLDARTEWVERTAQLAGSRRSQARALDYLLAGKETVTVSDLVELLQLYPANRVVFSASQVNDLLENPKRIPPELQEVVSLLTFALTDRGEIQEIRAGQLADWLASADLDPGLAIPKTPLIEILS